MVNNRARLSENILWLLVDRGSRLLVAFFVGIWTARVLGPELYGAFNYAQAWVGILAFLGVAGIETIVVKQLVEEPAAKNEILGSAFALRFVGGLATVLAACLLGVAQGSEHQSLLSVAPFLAAASLLQAFDIVDVSLRVELLSRYSVLARLSALTLGALLRVMALETSHPLMALAIAVAIEAAIAAVCLVMALRRGSVRFGSWAWNGRRMRSILALSWPVLLSGIAVAIYSRLSVVLLGNYHDQRAVGIFAVATVMVEAFHAIPTAVMASYAPVLLRRHAHSFDGLASDVAGLLRAFIPLSVAIGIVVVLGGDWLTSLLFGHRYTGSGPVLALLVWSLIFVYISIVSEVWFLASGALKYLLPKTLVAAAVSLILNLLLIPAYGAKGAAVATVVSYSVTAFWANALFPATRPLFWLQVRAMLFFR